MSEFNENEFQDFMAENEARTHVAEQMALIQNRCIVFLQERGVEFPDQNSSLVDADDIEAVIRTSKLAQNAVRVVGLAAQLVILEATTLAGHELDEELSTRHKKHTQARFIAEGAEAAWLELIDREFPGDPLSTEDDELINNVTLQTFTDSIEHHELWENTYQNIIDILAQNGLQDLTENEQMAVANITSNYCIDTSADLNKLDRREEIITVLLRLDISEHAAWSNVISFLQAM
jgi:hypothetical protein